MANLGSQNDSTPSRGLALSSPTLQVETARTIERDRDEQVCNKADVRGSLANDGVTSQRF